MFVNPVYTISEKPSMVHEAQEQRSLAEHLDYLVEEQTALRDTFRYGT